MADKLTLDDIADLRAYEREREGFRSHVIALKKQRRVAIGPFVSVVFENRDTVRFQIQEMARVERLLSDEAIETELRTYNPLIPGAGELAATLFLELTTKEELQTWLPRLVGIERAVELRIADGAHVVRCRPDADHEQQLTRDEITASVHYIHFSLSDAEVEAFAAGPVELAVNHPAYAHVTTLGDNSRASLLEDLRG
jgi:hypothetical protein